MSVQPRPWPEVPEQTVVVARAAFPKGTLAMRFRDELPGLFADEQFASAFGMRGKPGISPGQLALVTVLQFAENLTDRQAADAVRARIDWKYALGLELTDAGFDHTVLTGFRQRLIDHELEERVLDLLLARLSERGLVKARGRQRTDSTHVLAAVRSVNRLEFLAETLRAALEALAAAAPDWLATRIDAEWVARYGARADSYRLPAGQGKRTKMAVQVGVDGFAVLEALHAADAPIWLREIPAVVILRTVWIKQYHRTITHDRQEVAWREEKDLPPSRERICSPYDTDARYATKRGSGWEGYKVHVTETCDDVTATGRPHLVTNVATTDATVTDVEMLEQIHTDLDRRNLLAGEHIVDAGYTSAELMISAQRDFGITLLGPLRVDTSPQARTKSGFDRTAFTIDWDNQQATCPQGVTNTIWSACTERGRESIVVRFPVTACQTCPVRPQCTRSTRNGRQLMLRPRDIHDTVERARTEQTTDEWKQRYAIRAGVESTIHQAVAATGIRRSRYVGLPKTHLAHVFAATAINLIRLDAWWTAARPGNTRTSHLARLDLTLAA
ncbi:IS1182 family transposase [Saccharopolyspora shandongensis]|uniref:IS1182 family transposase n=1 Tax=Saccharopolyspora shandongensis TaxID=418495 RepID=UPI0033EB9938